MAAPNAAHEQEQEAEGQRRQRTNTMGSVAQSVQQAAGGILQRDPPLGFFAATADVVSHAPTIGEIRRGSYGTDGWHADAQMERRKRTLSSSSSPKRRSLRTSTGERELERERPAEDGRASGILGASPALTEEPTQISEHGHNDKAPPAFEEIEQADGSFVDSTHKATPHDSHMDSHSKHKRHEKIKPLAKVYSSGYIPPPVIPWTTSTAIGFKAFIKWFFTPFGFFLTLYGLNVVAWGGMLFLLLCNASHWMCWSPVPSDATRLSVAEQNSPAASLALKSGSPLYHNCNDINSPRRIWLEIDSQILNGLFCVTGFGLIPWRFRDLYYLLLWRMTSERKSGLDAKLYGLRTLAGFYRNWVRLPGSATLDEVSTAEYKRSLAHTTSITPSSSRATDLEDTQADPRLPLPLSKRPDDPVTAIRAPATATWKIDFFVWSQAINTFFQVALCGVMWGYNRYTRPSWATGLLIALACIIAGAGGWVNFVEGRKVKRVEGVRAEVNVEDDEADLGLQQTRTGRESWHMEDRKGGPG